MKNTILGLLNKSLQWLDARIVRGSVYDALRMSQEGKQQPDQSPTIRLDASLDKVRSLLPEQINLLLLGSASDTLPVPRDLGDLCRVVSLDALEPSQEAGMQPVKRVVAGKAGPAMFHERRHAQCSSMTTPKEALVHAYGLEGYYAPVRSVPSEAVTVEELSAAEGVSQWHFVKTDLEGLDFEVVASMGDRIQDALVVEMELRFQPFHEGEPTFHEVSVYMADRGFGVIDVRPERWRFHTPNMLYADKGCVAHVNTVFLRQLPEGTAGQALLQSLLLALRGYTNRAEHILRMTPGIAQEAIAEMELLMYGPQAARTPYLPDIVSAHVLDPACS